VIGDPSFLSEIVTDVKLSSGLFLSSHVPTFCHWVTADEWFFLFQFNLVRNSFWRRSDWSKKGQCVNASTRFWVKAVTLEFIIKHLTLHDMEKLFGKW